MVFISYARSDGSAFAERVHRELAARGFAVWRDVRSIDPYQDFSIQIEEGIRAAGWVVVCLTPSIAERADSFVRREVMYARIRRRPIIPLLFPGAELNTLVADLTAITFTVNGRPEPDFEGGVPRLLERLAGVRQAVPEPALTDPHRAYLEDLYEQIVDYLDTTVYSLLILRSRTVGDVVAGKSTRRTPVKLVSRALPVKALRHDTREFAHLGAAFEEAHGRLLLLGDPGAGKSTTLWAFAREAVAARLADVRQPLPVLAQVATWDPRVQPVLADWLREAASVDARAEFETGKALLLLDGLDELGRGAPGQEDPRALFLRQIPSAGRVLLTCRSRDYDEIEQRAPMGGAVVLEALNDAQMASYLQDQLDLLEAVRGDDALREMVRTPLLLSLLAYAYARVGTQARELRALGRSPGELRDKIFRTYVARRYKHEAARAGTVLPFSLERMTEVLGELAVCEATRRNALWAGGTLASDARAIIGTDGDALLGQAKRLHVVTTIGGSDQFMHLRLRDYFALPTALGMLHSPDLCERLRGVIALDGIADPRAVEPLREALDGADVDVPIAVTDLASTTLRQAILFALAPLEPDGGSTVARFAKEGPGAARIEALNALDEVAQTRKLRPDENDALIETVRHGSDREAMRAGGPIEIAGSREAVKELLAWEEEFVRRKMGWSTDEEDGEDNEEKGKRPIKEKKKKGKEMQPKKGTKK